MKKVIILVMLFGWLVVGGTAFAGAPNLVDVDVARKFLISLPTECDKSNMSALSDGTIKIHVICLGVDKGKIYIKDGKITGVED